MTTEELQVIISAQINDLQKKLDKASKETQAFAKEGESNLAKFNKIMAGVGKATAAAMKVTAGAIMAGAAALYGLSESTKEYRVAQAKLTTAFEAAGSSATQAKTTYNQLYRVLGDSDVAVEAANHLAKLTTEEKSLAEYTKIAQGVYATFGDSLAIEGLTEGINHTAKLGEVQGTLADALEWSGVSVEEFNEQLFWCNTEAEREALIRTTLNDLYSEAAEGYEENAASILSANEAQAKLTDSLAELGAIAEPIVTVFKAGLADALSSITPHIGTVAEGLTAMFNGDTAGGAAKIKEGIDGLVNSILTLVTDLLPKLLEVGVGIITSLLEGIIKAFPSVITTLTDLLPTLVTTIIGLIPQITGAILNAIPLLLNTITQVAVNILAGLGEIIPEILQQIITIIPQIVTALNSSVPILIEAAIQFLMAIVQAIPEITPPLVKSLPTIINSIIDTILNAMPQLLEGAKTLLMAIVQAIPQIIPAIVEAIPLILEAIISFIINYYAFLFTAVIQLFMAIIDAIPQIIPPLISALPQLVLSITGVLLKSVPTLLQAAITLFMALVTAIPKIAPKLITAIGSLIGSVLSSIGKLFKDVGTVIGNALGGSVKSALQSVLSSAIKIINGFISSINLAISVINAIPGVNIKKLNSLSVPKLAKGGIIDTATLAVVGEQGKEAVVPLENNLEWLDKLATMLTERLGNAGGVNTPIVLKVDKKVLGEISISEINNYTKRTGTMPLILV